jgi:hypothetical protein
MAKVEAKVARLPTPLWIAAEQQALCSKLEACSRATEIVDLPIGRNLSLDGAAMFGTAGANTYLTISELLNSTFIHVFR